MFTNGRKNFPNYIPYSDNQLFYAVDSHSDCSLTKISSQVKLVSSLPRYCFHHTVKCLQCSKVLILLRIWPTHRSFHKMSSVVHFLFTKTKYFSPTALASIFVKAWWLLYTTVAIATGKQLFLSLRRQFANDSSSSPVSSAVWASPGKTLPLRPCFYPPALCDTDVLCPAETAIPVCSSAFLPSTQKTAKNKKSLEIF